LKARVPANGIVFNALSGGSLTVINCVVKDFVYDATNQTTGNGILMQLLNGDFNVVITNTILSNNGSTGFNYLPPSGSTPSLNAAIDHVVATANATGIAVNGVAINNVTSFTISNSIASNNGAVGVYLFGGHDTIVSIDNVNASSNQTGIDFAGGTIGYISRSVVTANSNYGVNNQTFAAGGGNVYSYKNNQINGNASANDIVGNPVLTVGLQ